MSAISAFLLFFTAVRYYTRNAVIALIVGICAFFIFGAAAFFYIRKRQRKRHTLARDERELKLLQLHLSLLPESEVIKTLLPLIDGGKISGKTVETPESTNYFIFRLQPLSPDDIAGVIRKRSKKNKVIFCNLICDDARKLADDFKIKCVTGDEIFTRLKDGGLLPDKYAFEGEKRANIFARVKARFNRRLTAPLFWSGLCLTAFSYFTFYPLYYIIFGGLLLILAVVCLVFGKRVS